MSNKNFKILKKCIKSYLRLNTDDHKNEEALKCIYDIRCIPNVIWTSNSPAYNVDYPRNSHDDDQLHTNATQCGSVTDTKFAHFPFQPLTLKNKKQQELYAKFKRHRLPFCGGFYIITLP
jgi:hypothetical protein